MGRTLGSLIGARFGGAPGALLGGAAGDWFGRITGLGDYKISHNRLLTDQGPPLFRSKGRAMTVTHREFVSEITGSTAFTIQEFNINPGAEGTFPWLSYLAQGFENYKFQGLVFEFKTTSGTAVGSTNTALGVVVAATNYDVTDPIFGTRRQMEAYEFSTSCVPSQSMVHPVECAPGKNTLTRLYNRSEGEGINTGDLRFHDMGNLFIATEGMQADGKVVGELWVSYICELTKPKMPAARVARAHYWITAPDTDLPFGASMTEAYDHTMSVTPTAAGSSSFILLPEEGAYYACRYICSTTANKQSGFSNFTAVATETEDGPDLWISCNTGAATVGPEAIEERVAVAASNYGRNCWGVFKALKNNARLLVPNATFSSTGTSADLIVTRLTDLNAYSYSSDAKQPVITRKWRPTKAEKCGRQPLATTHPANIAAVAEAGASTPQFHDEWMDVHQRGPPSEAGSYRERSDRKR